MQSSEEQLLYLSIFFVLLGLSTHVSKILRLHPLILYLTIGAIFSYFPNVNIPPTPTYLALQLAGYLGILLSTLDTGIETSITNLKRCIFRGLLIAFLGVVFPLLFCVLFLTVIRNNDWKVSFAVGSSIAPTSLGVTIGLLEKQKEHNTQLGTLISIAAIFDDVISLILLSEITIIINNNISTWIIIKPILFSFLFITVGILITIMLPICINFSFRMINKKFESFQNHFIILYWLIIFISLLFVYIAIQIETSILLAIYLTGISFCKFFNHNSNHNHNHTHNRIINYNIQHLPWFHYKHWLNVLFFSCTIGFVIPLNVLFKKDSVILGLILGLIGIVGKLFCGIAVIKWNDHWFEDFFAIVIGMMGRGEFGFLIAVMAKEGGVLDDQMYAATVWGVIIPTIITPFVLPFVFGWRRKRLNLNQDSESESESESDIERQDQDEQEQKEEGGVEEKEGSNNNSDEINSSVNVTVHIGEDDRDI